MPKKVYEYRVKAKNKGGDSKPSEPSKNLIAKPLKRKYMHKISKPLLRVLARILKMPVQNNNFKFFAGLDLATYLLQILIPATFNGLVCQKGQFIIQLSTRRWFVWNISGYWPKLKNHHRNFCLSKQEVFRKLPVQKTGRTGPG